MSTNDYPKVGSIVEVVVDDVYMYRFAVKYDLVVVEHKYKSSRTIGGTHLKSGKRVLLSENEFTTKIKFTQKPIWRERRIR